jgi:anthranilate/para-aminobenzoate synthase component I
VAKLRPPADLCVVIRTILVSRGRVFVHTGGGIVASSDPTGCMQWDPSTA